MAMAQSYQNNNTIGNKQLQCYNINNVQAPDKK